MTAPTQQRAPLHQVMRAKLETANKATDDAIADYNEARAELMRVAGPDAGLRHVEHRDSKELAALGSRVAFRTSTAIRLGVTLQCELLAALLDATQRQTHSTSLRRLRKVGPSSSSACGSTDIQLAAP